MNKDENIATYFLRIDQIVNAIEALGEPMESKVVFQKVLRSLPMRFDAKVLVLEEREDFEKLGMDELHGIFTANEMRIE